MAAHIRCLVWSVLAFATLSFGLLKGTEAFPKCVHVVSINSPRDNPSRSTDNYGMVANTHKAFLDKKPGKFRLKKGGFLGINGTVAIESLAKPGYYLRHKNYRFHLERASNKTMFAKDTTFYLLKVQEDPPLFAFEMYNHSSWFVTHRRHKPYKLSLKHVTGANDQVMDSTFFLAPVRCHKHHAGHQERQEKAQKKTILVGHGTYIDTSDDDDRNVMEDSVQGYDKMVDFDEPEPENDVVNEVDDSAEKKEQDVVTEVDQDSSDKKEQDIVTVAEVEQDSSEKKEQDIVTEVEQAFNTSASGKNEKMLDDLETDIERKVDNLAKTLTTEKQSKLDNSSKDTKKPNSTSSYSSQEYTKDVDISTDTSKDSSNEPLDDVVIHTDSSSSDNKAWIRNQLDNMSHGKNVVKGEPKLVNFKANEHADKVRGSSGSSVNSKGVIKGSPKLMNENLEIISRNSLGIPETRSLEDHRREEEEFPSDENSGNAKDSHRHQMKYKHRGKEMKDKHRGKEKNGFMQAVELVHDAEEKLKDVLNQLDDHTTELKTVASGKIHRHKDGPRHYIVRGAKHGHIAAVLTRKYHKTVQEMAHGRQLNDTNSTSHNNNLKDTSQGPSAKIYYTEKCQDAIPGTCEEWAQKRYCLTFSELMKRYCRKACRLCDHVITTGFTTCDKTCGGGIRLRMLRINNRQVLQRRACNTNSCPIDGRYTPYSNFSECSSTCGVGLRYRHRTCTNPPPQFGGRDCTRLGSPVHTIPCHVKCKVADDSNEEIFYGSGTEHGDFGSGKNEADDYDFMPEYHMESLNKGYTVHTVEEEHKMMKEEKEQQGERRHNKTGFRWPSKKERKNPMILHHSHDDYYEHHDHHGNKHLLHVGGGHGRHSHLHTVRYHGKPVASLKCGPSKFLKYHRKEYNSPMQGMNNGQESFEHNILSPSLNNEQGYLEQNFKRDWKNQNFKRGLGFQNYKLYDEGKVLYDKYGMPTDTTKEVIKGFGSPYRIVLTKNKNHQMVVREECLESDSSVNPDMDIKADTLSDLESYVGPNGLSGTIKNTPTVKPKTSSLAANGFYEYKYEDPNQSYSQDTTQENSIGKEIKQALDKVATDETSDIQRSSLMGAKATLSEELAAENEEALNEKKFEETQARRKSMTPYRRRFGAV